MRIVDDRIDGEAGLVAEKRALVDDLLDELVPDELEWRHWVTSYPKSSLALAAAGGFLLGRARGRAMVAALAGFAAETATEGINEFLGRKVV